MKRIFLNLVCGSLVLLLGACAPPPKVAVEERDVITVRQETERMGGQLIRIAQPGDTLHSIAFASGLDVNKVATWNGIDDTSKLNVGQRVRLTEPIGFKYRKPQAGPNPKTKVERKPKPQPELAGTGAVTPSEPTTSSPTPRPNNVPKPIPKSLGWHWPTQGKVVRQFSLVQGRQGIDIQAVRGQTVMASDNGEVVYVGNSLKGYGNLIIVKHTEQYLSAYAYNENIFVREGQRVKARQKIGSVGVNNRRKNALHFQIRKNGKPVNPLLYLPKI